MTDGAFCVGDFVGKLITNWMIVQIPMKNSVGKYKNDGSDCNSKC
jgi:hypothetical protein